MGEALNGKLGPGIGVALILLAIGIIGYQYAGGNSSNVAVAPQNSFYTDDNGKTFFKDAVKVVPFDHGGKQAYRADVFAGPDGKQFVGLIYRFTDAGKREMQAYIDNKTKDPSGLARLGIEHRGMQVKPVGAADSAWVLADDNTLERLQGSVKAPGGGAAKLVTP